MTPIIEEHMYVAKPKGYQRARYKMDVCSACGVIIGDKVRYTDREKCTVCHGSGGGIIKNPDYIPNDPLS